MLGKLIKHEFRATARTFLPMYGIFLVLCVVARLYYSGLREQMFGGNVMMEAVSTVLVTLIVVVAFTAMIVVTVVLTLRRFWQNLLGREGYLMHVLPVESWEHVLSKLVVALVWTLASSLMAVAGLWVMMGDLIIASGDFMGFRGFSELWNFLKQEGLTGTAVTLVAEYFFQILAGSICFLLTVYTAMCLGCLASKHRVLVSVLAYLGINSVTSGVMGRLMLFGMRRLLGLESTGDTVSITFPGTDLMSLKGELTSLCWGLGLTICVSILFSCGLFFLCQWLMKKKLNLQ